MPIKIGFGGAEMVNDLQESPAAVEIDPSAPFRIGLLGDFRGRGGRSDLVSGRDLAQRPIVRVDRDNFEAVMARLGVALRLSLPGAERAVVALEFHALDDFHPDRLLDRADVFQTLRTARRRLANPATFRAAAAELGLLPTSSSAEKPASPLPEPPGSASAPGGDLLDLVVRETSAPGSTTAPVGPAAEVDALIDQIIAPYRVERPDPRQAELVADVDEVIAGLLRSILHHPDFQALEATWRAVHLLTRTLDTDSGLAIDLLDVTRAELEADLVASIPLERTATFKRIVESTVGTEGGQPFALLVADLTVAPTARDIVLLWRLGQVARLAGAPLIAGASPDFVGCPDPATCPDPDDWGPAPDVEGWNDLRRGTEAPYLCLALPRVLLRAPYGPDSSPIENFRFDEQGGAPEHASYLWGNPAYIVALILGREYQRAGGHWTFDFNPELSDMPFVVARHDGEARAVPCAEALLGTRAAERIRAAGLTPVLSVRDRDAVRLGGLVSIADPPAAPSIRGL